MSCSKLVGCLTLSEGLVFILSFPDSFLPPMRHMAGKACAAVRTKKDEYQSKNTKFCQIDSIQK